MKYLSIMYFALIGVTQLDLFGGIPSGIQDGSEKSMNELPNRQQWETCIQVLRMLTSPIPKSKFAIYKKEKMVFVTRKDFLDDSDLAIQFQECVEFSNLISTHPQIQYFKTHYLNYKMGYDMQGRKME
jgi:hypothetical protein